MIIKYKGNGIFMMQAIGYVGATEREVTLIMIGLLDLCGFTAEQIETHSGLCGETLSRPSHDRSSTAIVFKNKIVATRCDDMFEFDEELFSDDCIEYDPEEEKVMFSELIKRHIIDSIPSKKIKPIPMYFTSKDLRKTMRIYDALGNINKLLESNSNGQYGIKIIIDKKESRFYSSEFMFKPNEWKEQMAPFTDKMIDELIKLYT